jgi:hypothetical protein
MEDKYNHPLWGIQNPIPVMPRYPQLANAYVPYQYITCIDMPEKGLEKGTIFPQLFRPYDKKS